jgi:hypothetical protein
MRSEKLTSNISLLHGSTGFKLFRLFVIALIHGIFPFIFKKTVSDKIIKMGDELKKRK